jgi:hypothetical protein
MKRKCVKKNEKVHPAADQDLDGVDKICIRTLYAEEHFYNTGQEAVSILPENGLFSPFFELEFEE